MIVPLLVTLALPAVVVVICIPAPPLPSIVPLLVKVARELVRTPSRPPEISPAFVSVPIDDPVVRTPSLLVEVILPPVLLSNAVIVLACTPASVPPCIVPLLVRVLMVCAP